MGWSVLGDKRSVVTGQRSVVGKECSGAREEGCRWRAEVERADGEW